MLGTVTIGAAAVNLLGCDCHQVAVGNGVQYGSQQRENRTEIVHLLNPQNVRIQRSVQLLNMSRVSSKVQSFTVLQNGHIVAGNENLVRDRRDGQRGILVPAICVLHDDL